MDPAAAAALLEDLADRALCSEFEPVACLEAPEPAEVPRGLLRADGRSVYQRHGGIRYATRAQLVMEERMLAQARASGAPRLTRAQAAHALGAEPGQLDAALTGCADAAQDTRTQTGLRTDQAAAAHAVLTDGQRVSVINAPAGSGKTRVLTDTGRAWTTAGLGPVVGITASQSARNTLAAGVPVSYNAAQFLGHLPGRRGARGPVETGPAPLLVIDEASAMPGPDLADLIAYAQARDGKVVLAGDTGQLQAVENGGGMSLLAGALGYVRLAEPVRFRHVWEQQASLRLHDGDTTMLAEYDQHGRIAGGEPEQMMDAAAAAYVALTCDGTDVLLMAADHALRRELCRRIRDDLIALGVVAAGPAVRIADGAQASAPSPTPTTWPCCTPSGPPRLPPPGSSATATCSWPPCPPNTAANRATRPGGSGAPCAAPNWPAWTPGRSWPTRSPNGTWPAPATCPASSTPGSGTGSAARSRSRRSRGPRRSPASPTPTGAPTPHRSPR